MHANQCGAWHQRQMQMFSENSTKFMDEFSKEFEDVRLGE